MTDLKTLIVDDYTTPSPIYAEKDTKLSVVYEMMDEAGIRHVPITDAGRPVGIISDRDLKTFAGVLKLGEINAVDAMSADIYVVRQDTPLQKVVYELSARKIGSAIVVDEHHNLVGIFTVTDALNALIEIIQGTTDFEFGS